MGSTRFTLILLVALLAPSLGRCDATAMKGGKKAASAGTLPFSGFWRGSAPSPAVVAGENITADSPTVLSTGSFVSLSLTGSAVRRAILYSGSVLQCGGENLTPISGLIGGSYIQDRISYGVVFPVGEIFPLTPVLHTDPPVPHIP